MKKLRIPAFLLGKTRVETVLHCMIAALVVYFLGALALVFTAARYPRALMWLVRPLNATWLPMLCLLACAVLGKMTCAAFRIANVRFTAFHRYVLLGALLVSWVVYFTVVLGRNILYYWDFSCYYSLQLYMESAFSTDLRQGFATFYSVLMQNDYTPFINLFTELPFCFTDRTMDAYLLCSTFTVLPALFTLSAGLLIRLGEAWQVRRPRVFYVLGLICVLCFPLLHAAYLSGQPDVFGLVFALLILLLTQGYAFEGRDVERLALLFFATLFLFLSRRWYLFFIAAYYACFAVSVVLRALLPQNRSRRRAMLLRLVGFGAGSILLGCTLLLPIVRHIFNFDYAKNYSGYLHGGFPVELVRQFRWIGMSMAGLMALGFVFGCIKKRVRFDALLAAFAFFIALFGFTRIQNMGEHQSLLLAPSYLMLLFCGAAAVCAIPGKLLSRLGAGLFGICLALNCTAALQETPTLRNSPLFTNISLRKKNRTDVEAVLQIDRWLLAHCDAEQDVTAYMIPHGNFYNPDVFRYALAPDLPLHNVLSYGSAVRGSHRFPYELFDATYVLTCEPFDGVDLSKLYNDIFLHNGFLEERFRPVLVTDMQNGYTFTVYERTAPIDLAEVESYRAALVKENEAFPVLIGDILDAYISIYELK